MEEQAVRPRDPAAPPTMNVLRGLATIPVFHPTRLNAADVLGISRGTAYALARSGDLPTIHLGSRVVVPVPALLRMLGAEESS